MKRKILLVLSLIAALFVVSSCSSENTQTSEGKVVTQTNNVVVNTSALQLQTPTALAINIVEPYTFELSGFGENYIVTAASENAGAQIRFSVEDNKYNSTDYLMNAPDGYFAGTLSKVNCFVIKAPKNNPNVPDLLQVNFEPLEQNTNKKQVAAFYSVKSSELLPVRVYTTIPYNLAELQFCEDTVLIRTEDYKFMPPPTVTWNAEGTPSVSIYTYTFDTTRMTLTKAAEAVSADNQLYFSYSALALAGDVASMFTTKTLAVSSDKEFVSITNAETGDSEHYFLVSDPRFSTSEELVAFANQYFAPEITAELYKNAPQKYRDINGQLYTLRLNTVAAVKTPVIADILEEDTDLSVQITGGGSVVIRKDGENFKIMKYTLV